MKAFITLLFSLFLANATHADWVVTAGNGEITSVRTYQAGADGLRAQIHVVGISHNCGTGPGVFYFDSDKIPMDVVKSVLSLAMGAMASNKSVRITYDCSVAGGGYGWGVAMTVIK